MVKAGTEAPHRLPWSLVNCFFFLLWPVVVKSQLTGKNPDAGKG